MLQKLPLSYFLQPIFVRFLSCGHEQLNGPKSSSSNGKSRGGKVDRESSYFFLGDWPYPRRHPEFSALSKSLAIILLNNGATACDMKQAPFLLALNFCGLRFMFFGFEAEELEELFWLRQNYTYILAREQKYSYLLARKRHENSGWRLGLLRPELNGETNKRNKICFWRGAP